MSSTFDLAVVWVQKGRATSFLGFLPSKNCIITARGGGGTSEVAGEQREWRGCKDRAVIDRRAVICVRMLTVIWSSGMAAASISGIIPTTLLEPQDLEPRPVPPRRVLPGAARSLSGR